MKKSQRTQARKAPNRTKFFQSSPIKFNGMNLNGMRLRDIPFALALAFGAVSSHAEPTGGAVAAGQAAISAMNGVTTVQQMSDRAIVNWQSFNINAGEEVKFVQPSSTAAILNRVTGGSVSNLSGLLEGNGRVYLINPNGIVVGANGVVNVNGGFVASTKGIADSAFMSGGALVFTGESTGSIQVLGKVQSAQGDVILIAPKVAIEKTAELIAGQSIKLVAANEVELSNGKLTVKPKAEDAGQVTVEGALHAAKVQLTANNNNLGALAINTSGSIRATGTQTNPDGSVSIIATGEGGNIHISGNIRSEKGAGHGGAVTILADNGIRINGTVNANTSVGADSSKTGGDIYIGRDVTTNKLARATDVSGATLLSNKGFVETSGDWLKTHNITVLAKDWLLDPTDIKIVATGTASADTASSTTGTTTTFQDTTTIDASEVLKSTIETAINNGTSVTITTANGPGNGSGNITIETALSFTNNGAQDATFKLLARNGITQNVGSSITATGNKLVHIEMIADGKHLGSEVGQANWDATKSNGIVLNEKIITNGNVKIEASNRNTGGNSIGVRFNNNSGITAASYDVKGSATSTATSSYGVGMFGKVAFKSTSDSMINGTSLSQTDALSHGTMIYDGADISFDAGSTGGKLVVKGSNDAWETGLRISGFSNASTKVTTDGDVTLGALEDKSQFSFRAGTITANSGKLTILGQLVGGGTAVSTFDGASITGNNGVSIEIKGVAKGSATAVGLGQSSPLAIKALQGTAASAGNISITAQSNSGNAINISSASTLEAANVTLSGTSTSSAGINGTGKITATTGNVKIDGLSTTGGSGGWVLTNQNISATNGNIDITGTTLAAGREAVYLSANTLSAKNISVTGTSGGGVGMPENAKGIRSFATISTTNAITLDGISANVTGVGLEGGSVTAGGALNINGTTTNGIYQGANIGVAVKGSSVKITGSSRDHLGVAIGAAVTATNGDVEIKGTSVGNHGVAVNPSVSVTSNLGSIKIEGTSTSNAGVFIGTSSTTVANINAKNNVSITGVSTASTGVNLGSPNGNAAYNAIILSGGDTSVTGTGVTGVRVWAGSSIDAKNINLLGTSVTRTAGESGIGVDFERIVSTANFKSTDDINIEGTLTGVGIGSGVKTSWRNQNGNGPTMNAGGNFTLRANNRALASNTNAAINTDSGMQVTAGKNIVVQAETNNSAARAMIFYSLSDMYRGNTSFASSGGDILIQANQGAIVFNNQQGSAAGQLTDITGRNITIDNTGAGMATGSGSLVGSGGTKGGTIGSGSIDTTTGAIVAGAGKASADGINFADARKVEASGNLNIMGASTANWGVKNINLLKGGAVNIQGTSETSGGIFLVGEIASTLGSINMVGRSTTASGGSGITLQAQVNAKTDINLEGYSANTNNVHGLVIQDAVTSETGTINLIGETKAATQRAIAITSNGSKFASLNTSNQDITMIGNTVLINSGTTVNAGSGTVKIKTLTAGNEIALGTEDVMSSTISNQKLGLSNDELNRIAASNLVVGDTSGAGKITVASATTTQAQTGNIVLQTQGDILIDKALTLTEKNLTLNGGGVNSQITQNAAIIVSNLELLGANATHTLTHAANAVGTIAANVKSMNFTNGEQLTVGAVNSTIGLTAKDGVTVTTQLGDLNLNEVINNTLTGNVVVGAGVSKAAGDKTGGNVKTSATKNITHANGKLYVYSGGTAATGLMSHLNADFSELRLSGDMGSSQNAESNVEYMTGGNLNKIASDSEAQVMFREKISLDTSTVNGALLEKTYGDANTSDSLADQLSLLEQMKEKLTQANQGEIITRLANADQGVNVIKISKAALINDLTGVLTSPEYSSSDYLTAKTHDYGELTSSKYTASLDAAKAQVNIGKKALTGSIESNNSTYGESLNLNNLVTLNGILTNDKVTAGDASIDLNAFNTSTSGHLKAGAHIQTLSGITGDDANNYTFASVKGNYTVNRLALAGTRISDVTTTYGTPENSGAVSFSNLQGTGTDVDIVTATANIDNQAFSTSGNLRAGSYTQSVEAITGTDADNYTFAGFTSTANYSVERLALTGAKIADVTTTYGTSASPGKVTFANIKINASFKDDVTASAIIDNQEFSTTGQLKAGSYNQSATTALSGIDAENYTFGGLTSVANYKVNQLLVTIIDLSDMLTYTGGLLTQKPPTITNKVNANGKEDIVVIDPKSLARGAKVGTYTSPLMLYGEDALNYIIDENGTLVIKEVDIRPPTNAETYTPTVGDAVNLTPITFAVGVSPSTDSGDDADPNTCFTWGQRQAGDVTVYSVLKPSYLGLRNAKTDAYEASGSANGGISHLANPCGQTNKSANLHR